ncbi:immune inhibitor A [Bacillus pakistanensis]|uniref:Immune inhibitor A n=1 Tax=Rossellomorea pakistanensis TaxID=992288 RepID=A0ABS2NB27_9BACI|nr:immune inhibitor A [Bacillus pakistanensis]
MKASKVLSMAMVAALTVGAFAVPTSSSSVQPNVSTNSVSKETHSHGNGPFDLAIANEEKLIEMLKESGKIAKDASGAEAEKVLKSFLHEKAESASKLAEEEGELHDEKEKLQKQFKENLKKGNGITNGNGKKKGHTKKDKPENVKEEQYNGDVREDKVLVLLVEFPDFPHNSINPEDTDMYYEDYVKEHYQDMVFGENGYVGPNGENIISMKQYYEQQSGGSYTVDGEVAGWYMAKNPAAYYGGNVPAPDGSDANARALVKEALTAAAADPAVDLSDYDIEDRYDLDGDGNKREADGLVDHLMVVHSTVGEEAGGGSLGGDAIWSHRWNLGGVFPIPGSESESPNWGGSMAAFDYTIEPADGAVGVFAHEYGHDLGLPDEYDTQYSGAGEPVAYWSLMASGSWAGDVPGAQPTGFSAWSKEFLQANHGGNWFKGSEVNFEDIDKNGLEFLLDQGNTKGTNLDGLKVNLPDKETVINTPYSGEFEYFSGSGDNLDNSAVMNVDLTNASSAELNFKAWYDIEVDWDYGSVQVKQGEEWVAVPGNITTDTDPHEQNPGHGITGKSDGWVDAKFDLSAYAGQNVEVKINYWTDVAATNPGLYVDDIQVLADGEQVLFDDAEGEAKVSLEGFTKNNGVNTSKHYYLLEWRNHQGVDEGLANLRRGNSLMSYDPGLVVWYVDNTYSENWTGIHPGNGFLGVVDADQGKLSWSDGSVASTRYQVHDAAFSLEKSEKMFLDYSELLGITMKDNKTNNHPLFDDSKNYRNDQLPDAGRNVPNYGLKFRVTGESPDRSVGKVLIYKK